MLPISGADIKDIDTKSHWLILILVFEIFLEKKVIAELERRTSHNPTLTLRLYRQMPRF